MALYLAVPVSNTPHIHIYKWNGSAYIKLSNPSTLPAFYGICASFSNSGDYLAVSHYFSPYITIYKRTDDTFTKLTNPGNLPTGTAWGCIWSHDDSYLVVTHETTPFITIYSRSGDTFTKVSNPGTLPTGTSYSAAFNSDSSHLAIAHSSSPYVTIYSRSGDTFTKLADPVTLPSNNSYSVNYRSSGHLAVGHAGSPYVTIYSISGSTYTKITNPSSLPPDSVKSVRFSPDGNYLATAHTTTPCITIYSRSGDTFTKVADPDTVPSGSSLADGVAWRADGAQLCLSWGSTPYIYIYNRSGDTFTKQTNPATLPPASAKQGSYYGVADSIDSTGTGDFIQSLPELAGGGTVQPEEGYGDFDNVIPSIESYGIVSTAPFIDADFIINSFRPSINSEGDFGYYASGRFVQPPPQIKGYQSELGDYVAKLPVISGQGINEIIGWGRFVPSIATISSGINAQIMASGAFDSGCPSVFGLSQSSFSTDGGIIQNAPIISSYGTISAFAIGRYYQPRSLVLGKGEDLQDYEVIKYAPTATSFQIIGTGRTVHPFPSIHGEA